MSTTPPRHGPRYERELEKELAELRAANARLRRQLDAQRDARRTNGEARDPRSPRDRAERIRVMLQDRHSCNP